MSVLRASHPFTFFFFNDPSTTEIYTYDTLCPYTTLFRSDRSGVDQAHAVVGASYGGMVALSLGQHFPARVKRIVVISAGASAHPAATALRELQRRVVALGIAEGAAAEALSIARDRKSTRLNSSH